MKQFFLFLKHFFFFFIFICSIELTASARLLIKLPTRERPVNFFKMLDLYYERLSEKFPYHFLITCDTDDKTMNNPAIISKLKSYKNLSYRFAPHKTKIEACNSFLDEFIQNYDIILLASDDMEPVINFDQIIIEKMLKHFPNFDGTLNFFDGYNGGVCNTYPILGYFYYLRFGYIYHPSYKSYFCDEEFTFVAEMLEKQAVFNETIVLHHRHPYYDNTIPFDQLYEKNYMHWDYDKNLFLDRQKHNFYLEV